MTQATTKDYWISPQALFIDLNAMGNPDYIQASCVSGAQILVYVKGIIDYDAGHNYRRWTLQAFPTVFNTHTQKYVYVAIPKTEVGDSMAYVVFPSEEIDIYGKNANEEQIGSTDYYYVFLQGVITSSGDNGTVNRDWNLRISTGYLSSDEAIAALPNDSEWYKFPSVDNTVMFLKDITMKAGTMFHDFFAKTLTIVSGGKISFENQGEISGVADDTTSISAINRVVTPKYLDDNALSSVNDDTAQGLITFVKGLVVKAVAEFSDGLRSTDYDNAAEQGFSIEKDGNGKYQAFLTNLTVWGKALFHELEIRKLSYAGGNIYLSGAGSKIVRAVPVRKVTATSGTETTVTWEECDVTDSDCMGWKCYLLADDGTTATMNHWQEGDQARCQTMGEITSAGSYEDVSNRSYWRTIPDGGVSTANEKIYGTRKETYTDADGKEQTRETQVELYDGQGFAWIVIGKHSTVFDGVTEGDISTADLQDVPMAGDTIVLDGNRHRNDKQEYDKRERQNVILLETTGDYAPRIACFANVTEYKHTVTKDGKEVSLSVFETSPKGGTKINSSRFEWVSDDGSTINIINYRGDWSSTATYHKNDQVNHLNAVWVCVANSGVDVTEEPSDTASYWKKVLSGGKGEKGDDAVTYELVAYPGYIKLNADGSIDYSNGYTDPEKGFVDGRRWEYLVVRGYKVVNGVKDNKFATDEKPITCRLSFNGGDAYFDYTAETNDEVNVDFDPDYDKASMGSLPDEISKNNLKNATAIMFEGIDYSSDKILARLDIPIVQDGKDGASGTSHGVALTVEKRTSSSVEDDCLVVTFTKGDTDGVTTTNNVQDIGGYAQLYVDGKIDTTATSRLNLGTSEAGELQKGAFPQVFTAGYVTVKWYDKEGGTLLGMGSLTRGTDGKDATVYGVQVTSYSEWIGSGRQSGLQFGFTKTTGATVETFADVTKMGCTVKVYGDGTLYGNVTEWINKGNGNFLFSSFPYNNVVGNATLGDVGVVDVELYLGSTLVATANYANGKQGADGKSALEIVTTPEEVTFDTNDNGLVDTGLPKEVTVKAMRGGKAVSGVTYKLKSLYNCNADVSSDGTVTITAISKDNTYGVSATSGYVELSVTDPTTGTAYTPCVRFSVNVAKFTGGMKADNKKFETAYGYLTNGDNTDTFTYYESKIRQTAKDISLHVSEKKAGRRNLLAGSAFRKQGEGCYLKKGADADGITIVGGYEGTNAAKITAVYNGYRGVWWSASIDSRNLKIKRNTKYTLSVWVKAASASGLTVYLEFIYKQSETGGTSERDGAASLVSYDYPTLEAGKWQLFTKTVQTDDKHDYAECNFWANTADSSSTVDVLFCRPMLEEGKEYNGWTLSEQDYDYVGGNLLDNTATLAQGGNVETLNPDYVTQGGMGESASVRGVLAPTATESDFLQYSTSGMGLKANEDYILSFYAKADSNPGMLQCYLYPSEGNINTEDSDGGYDNSWNPTDGDLKVGIVPGTQWKRYWVHWRPQKNDPKHVLFRLKRKGTEGEYSSTKAYAVGDEVVYDGTLYRCIAAGTGNTPSSSSSYWQRLYYQVYLSQPKLEVGATMTEYTTARADMVDKQALYATGIDIDSRKITLTASNTTFRDNDGNELAVIDGDGLRATKIATTDNGSGHTVISGNTTIWYQKDGVTPGIMVFYDEAGVPHFQFCGSDGKVKYDFGPSGLQSFISSTQKAYSDVAYLHDAKSYVSVNTSGTVTKVTWCYVKNKLTADQRYVYRKQIPTTDVSKDSDIYDGCVFNKEYSGTNWPSNDTSVSSWLLTDGWYVEPNDGNLPTKVQLADEGIDYDPSNILYYQDFYYYSSGKRTRTVRGYFKRNSNTSDPYSKFGDGKGNDYAVSCEEL